MCDSAAWCSASGTWFSGIGTIVVAIIAVSLSFIQYRRSVNLDEKAHASRISAWTQGTEPAENGSTVRVRVHNTSGEQIYKVVLFWVFIQGTGPKQGEECVRRQQQPKTPWRNSFAVFGAVPPGKYEYSFSDVDAGIIGGRLGVEIAFVDRNDTSWIRRADGRLKNLGSGRIAKWVFELINKRAPGRIQKWVFELINKRAPGRIQKWVSELIKKRVDGPIGHYGIDKPIDYKNLVEIS
jgi:hypothetical protein